MSRSYLPSKVSEIVALWRNDLKKVNPKAAESLADPEEYLNLFDDWQVVLSVESKVSESRGTFPPSKNYVRNSDRSNTILVEAFRNMQGEEDNASLENGDVPHEETGTHDGHHEEEHDEEEEEAIVVDVDSNDCTILVNGNEAEEEWGTKNKGTASA